MSILPVYDIKIEDFKSKFIKKMKELAEKNKTDNVKYYRLDVAGGTQFEYYGNLNLHHHLFKASNEFELWLTLLDQKIIYDNFEDIYADKYDYNDDLNYWYNDVEFNKNWNWSKIIKPLSELTEDEIVEWLVMFEIKTCTYNHYLCSEEIWWVEMTLQNP